MRDVRIARQPVDRHRQRAGGEVALRVHERPRPGVEDVRVENLLRMGEQRVRHPGDVPDRELAVGALGAGERRQMRAQRVVQDDGEQPKTERRNEPLATASADPRHEGASILFCRDRALYNLRCGSPV